MRLRRACLLFLLAAFTAPAAAQITTVTGTVTDPHGVPYAGGTIKAQLSAPGATVTVNNQGQCSSGGFGTAPCQVPIQGTFGPTSLDTNGSFTLNLYDRAQIRPLGTTWTFTVGISPGVAPPFGTGGQSFTVTLATITGASIDISAPLSAAAPALTLPLGGSGNLSGTLTAGMIPYATAANTLADSPLSFFGGPPFVIVFNAAGGNNATFVVLGTGTNQTVSLGSDTGVAVNDANGCSVAQLSSDPLGIGDGVISAGALPLNGCAGGVTGAVKIFGAAGGTATITVQTAAGNPVLTLGTNSGTPVVTASAPLAINTATGNLTISNATITTATNCNSSASPAVCAAAAAGTVVVAAAATTVVVDTTAVTANSEIFLQYDSSLGTRLGVTCNVTEPALYGVTARTAGTSFTITATSPIANPACFSYQIVN